MLAFFFLCCVLSSDLPACLAKAFGVPRPALHARLAEDLAGRSAFYPQVHECLIMFQFILLTYLPDLPRSEIS